MIESPKKGFFQLKWDFDVADVHKTALRILEEIGIQVGSELCLGILESAGCQVDYDTEIVRLPEAVVDKALSVNRNSHRVYNRDGTSFVTFGGDNLLLTSGACQIRIKEYNSGYRDADLADLVKLTRLHDYYDCIDIVHTAVDAGELSHGNMRTQMAATLFKNTSKPCWLLASHPDAVDNIFKMASAIRGSDEDLKQKPFIRIAVAPNSVLGFQKEEAEVLMRCTELGIPADSEHYPIMGLTAPLSISGALALTAVNFLCALVLKTTINPSIPSIFPVLAGVVNMKNAEIVTSSPEIWQYYLAGIEMGRFYNLPTSIIISSDAKSLDIQMAFEKAIGHFISAGAGVSNIFDATGALDSMNLTSYEGVAVELEFFKSFSRFFKGIQPSGKENDFEIIKKGINNNLLFLDSEHTIENYREFLWNPELLIKDNFQSWLNMDSPGIIDLARIKVKEILNTHQPNQLPDKVVREIDGIAGIN